jgi:aspartyl-tRNA(Asn)/glutamyl-tRNA(Gln) amidotransferase subunit B
MLAEIIADVSGGGLSLQGAKQLYAELLRQGREHKDAIVAPKGFVLKAEVGAYTVIGVSAQLEAKRLGLMQVQDTGALEGWVDGVLAANPGEVARYKGGETKLIGFFVGQVMKKSGGKADPKGVKPILQKKLGA